jgi:hypothetical protein
MEQISSADRFCRSWAKCYVRGLALRDAIRWYLECDPAEFIGAR